jgi:D-beta-D-heptose 7-phosphate kinase/D-beta-D-heptose 1-phosphate adenosyltransferase
LDEDARRKGDILIVAVNSDSSVRKLKGRSRPIITAKERAEVLASLEPVDFVTVFAELTPQRIISEIKPDVLVKGGTGARTRS